MYNAFRKESDDEDDYMSDKLLAKCEDTRPGLLPKKISKRYLADDKRRVHDQKSKTKPRIQLEKEKREVGLGEAIGSQNKGFALLQKMGYKPGMTLGKRGTGISEPVPIEVKNDRAGLGRHNDLKRKQESRSRMLAAMSVKKQKRDQEMKQTFCQRVSEKVSSRQVARDLYRSQKVCEQLDAQKGTEMPSELFFWPEALLPNKKQKEKDVFEEGLDEGYNFTDMHDDAEDSEEEEEPTSETLLTDGEKLDILTEYLRTRHVYCVWCGTAYQDEQDLQSNCPGSTAEAHDD
ncbi:hypothetical protein ScPMuIL_013810 [Solemya velum]